MTRLACLGSIAIAGIAVFALSSSGRAQRRPAAQAVAGDTLPTTLRENARNIRILLDTTRTDQQRLEAAEATQGFIRVNDVTAAITIVRDPSESPQLRARLLEHLQHAAATDWSFQRNVLGFLADANASRELRAASMATIENLMFAATSESRPSSSVVETLRVLLADADPDLRMRAFSALVAQGDEVARARLIRGLQSPTEARVPAVDAVRLLGEDLQPDALPALREMLQAPPDEATRIEAIRELGRDSASREQIAAYLRDLGQPVRVRSQALATLNANLTPDQFVPYALEIVRDDSAPDALRTDAIRFVQDSRETLPPGASEDAFDGVVRTLAASSPSAELRAVASEYLRTRGISP